MDLVAIDTTHGETTLEELGIEELFGNHDQSMAMVRVALPPRMCT
jgi:hypothetical protein